RRGLGTLEIVEGHFDLTRARRAAAHGDHAGALMAFRAAAARLQTSQPHMSIVKVRLERAIAELEASPGWRRTHEGTDDAARGVLEIGAGESWFRVCDGARVDIQARGTLRRVLHRIVEERLRSPGESVSTDALLSAGWPGELVTKGSGQARVRMAIATLR